MQDEQLWGYRVTTNKGVVRSLEPKISAYPNPTKGSVTLKFPGEPVGPSAIQVLDATGKPLFTIKAVHTKQQIDLSEFAAGLYLIKIQFNGKIYMEKVTHVKQ